MRRRTMAWYAEHPRAFEEAVRANDERELSRYEAEQDRLQAKADGRRVNGWLLASDAPNGELKNKQEPQGC